MSFVKVELLDSDGSDVEEVLVDVSAGKGRNQRHKLQAQPGRGESYRARMRSYHAQEQAQDLILALQKPDRASNQKLRERVAQEREREKEEWEKAEAQMKVREDNLRQMRLRREKEERRRIELEMMERERLAIEESERRLRSESQLLHKERQEKEELKRQLEKAKREKERLEEENRQNNESTPKRGTVRKPARSPSNRRNSVSRTLTDAEKEEAIRRAEEMNKILQEKIKLKKMKKELKKEKEEIRQMKLDAETKQSSQSSLLNQENRQASYTGEQKIYVAESADYSEEENSPDHAVKVKKMSGGALVDVERGKDKERKERKDRESRAHRSSRSKSRGSDQHHHSRRSRSSHHKRRSKSGAARKSKSSKHKELKQSKSSSSLLDKGDSELRKAPSGEEEEEEEEEEESQYLDQESGSDEEDAPPLPPGAPDENNPPLPPLPDGVAGEYEVGVGSGPDEYSLETLKEFLSEVQQYTSTIKAEPYLVFVKDSSSDLAIAAGVKSREARKRALWNEIYNIRQLKLIIPESTFSGVKRVVKEYEEYSQNILEFVKSDEFNQIPSPTENLDAAHKLCLAGAQLMNFMCRRGGLMKVMDPEPIILLAEAVQHSLELLCSLMVTEDDIVRICVGLLNGDEIPDQVFKDITSIFFETSHKILSFAISDIPNVNDEIKAAKEKEWQWIHAVAIDTALLGEGQSTEEAVTRARKHSNYNQLAQALLDIPESSEEEKQKVFVSMTQVRNFHVLVRLAYKLHYKRALKNSKLNEEKAKTQASQPEPAQTKSCCVIT